MPTATTPLATEPAPVDAAERALVYCTVEWSGPERSARPIIRQAIALLRAEAEPIDFDFFIIPEDSTEFEPWLKSHGRPGALGAASVYWLESGRVVAFEINALIPGVAGLVERTRALWGRAA